MRLYLVYQTLNIIFSVVIGEPVEVEKHGSNPRLQGRLPIYVVHMMIVPQLLNPKP